MANPTKQFGALPPRYKFMVNPYPDKRIRRCPLCEQPNRQRKLPLLILVESAAMIALNYTCRFCPTCDLLVAHKHEIEKILTDMFRHTIPSAIGNKYFFGGTVTKDVWREGLLEPQSIPDTIPHVSDFVFHYKELRLTQAGWFPANRTPPVMQPPPSKDWVKARR